MAAAPVLGLFVGVSVPGHSAGLHARRGHSPRRQPQQRFLTRSLCYVQAVGDWEQTFLIPCWIGYGSHSVILVSRGLFNMMLIY